MGTSGLSRDKKAILMSYIKWFLLTKSRRRSMVVVSEFSDSVIYCSLLPFFFFFSFGGGVWLSGYVLLLESHEEYKF